MIQKIKTLFFLTLFSCGCATHQMKVGDARKNLVSGNYEKAAELLKPMAEKEDDDQLVFLLEYGTALQLAGKFKESNEVFVKADRMSDIKDYHSLSRVTGSLLFSESMVQYKGEDYERVLINAFAAMNFLMMEDLDSALVEVRRLNEKLTRYKNEAKKPYEQSVFARYLSAMIWESSGKYDDAYIDYLESYKLDSRIGLLKEDLLRLAKKSRRMDDYEKWKKEFLQTEYKKEWDDKNYGEIVFLFQQGWGPVKRPNPESPRFPRLYTQYSRTKSAKLNIEGLKAVQTQPLYNISEVTIKSFNDQMGALIAKRLAGFAAKEVMADQIRQKNEGLGALAQIAMHVSDQADTRHWSTLPESIQISRVRVPAGEYKVAAQGLDHSDLPTSERMVEQKIKVRPRKITFVMWRSFQ